MYSWCWYRKESFKRYWALWPLHSCPVLCKSATENTWGEARPSIDLQWIMLLWCCLLHGVTFLSQSLSSGQVNIVCLRMTRQNSWENPFQFVLRLDKYWSREGFLCNRLKHCLTISFISLFFFPKYKKFWLLKILCMKMHFLHPCLLPAVCTVQGQISVTVGKQRTLE